jgi:peptidoglycan/LPS O-acetylase OafA/YrhL
VFYARRVLRIFPLYFTVLLLYLVLSHIHAAAVFFTDLFDNPLPLWAYFVYLQNWMMAFKGSNGAAWLAVTWSLAIEEQFYLILPAIVYLLRKRPLVKFLTAFAVSSLALRLYLYPSHPDAVYFLTVTRADSLMMGVLCAIALRTKAITDVLIAQKTLVYGMWAIFLCGFAFISYHGEIVGSYDLTPVTYFWLSVFYSLTLMLAMTDRSSAIIRKLFRVGLLQRTGGIAYGLYLMHPIVISRVLYLHKSDKLLRTPVDGLVMALAIVITFIVAEASWRWFEKPLVRIGRLYEYGNRVLTVRAP